MKRIVTQQSSSVFTYFSVAILFCLLTFNVSYLKANTHAISTTDEFSAANFNDEISEMNSLNTSVVSNEKATLVAPIITPDVATNIKLTTATIGATILPAISTVIDRGIVWGTTKGVTEADNKTPAGGTIGGTFTVDVTGLNRSNTIYYKGYYTTIADGTVLSAESSFSNVPVFNGTGTWNDPAHWSTQEVPGNVAGDSVVIDGICTVGNLTINIGAMVTIKAAMVLTVTGTLTNDAWAAGLLIKSDQFLPNGSLVYAAGNPLATVEMYSKASWDLNQTDGSRYSWQYFGIPVKTFTNDFSNCFIRIYSEISKISTDPWMNQSSSIQLLSGTGYEIVQKEPTTYKFSGELINTDFKQPVSFLAGTDFPGQHVFANPYTAAIDIKAIEFDGNTEQSVYLYNTGTYNQWLDNANNTITGTDSIPGQYTVSTPKTAGILKVPSQIPSMQGFLVKTLNQTDGSITIPYIGGVIPNTRPQRAPGENKNVVADKVATLIDLSGSHKADCMWIFTDPTCSTKFDNGWDGYKLKGSVGTPQLYAMEANGDFQIDALSDINGTYLGFVSGQETDYKLTFTHLNTEKRYAGIYLVDLIKNVTTDVTTSGSEYAFTSEPSQVVQKRFKIVTSLEVDTKTLQVSSLIKVFNSNGILFIHNFSNQNGNLILYNLNGVAIKQMEFKANKITTFSTSNLSPGAYIASASTNLEKLTERIIIR